jgi:Ca2+-binding RTX toxin-like protein
MEDGVKDTYQILLSRRPTADVTVTINAADTRTTHGKETWNQKQVELSLDNITYATRLDVTFTTGNWNTARTIYVRAIDNTVVDGNDTQVFAPQAETLNKIRGPLILQGASGSGSLSLPAPLLLPGELNIHPSDGFVAGFTAGLGAGTYDRMTVKTADLASVLANMNLSTVSELAGKTLQLTEGPGTGLVLDPSDPRNLYDRVWMIISATVQTNGTTLLELQNPTQINPGSLVLPTTQSKYAITNMSQNFFADEKTQVDLAMILDGDSVANTSGAMTSALINNHVMGRITGLGMDANSIIGGTVQPGGITYGDIEVMEVNLGSGNNDVTVDYTTHAKDHITARTTPFYTLTTLNTGKGDDTVTVNLDAAQDGAFALNTGDGTDHVYGGASTLPLVIFGGSGNDTVFGGSGADTIFGDQGRVDYVNGAGEIITRLGESIPQNPVNPPVTSATATTLTDSSANFTTEYGGLAGLVVQAIDKDGNVQFRTIVSNTATQLTINTPWDHTPDNSFFYRVAALPEDQTDGKFRGPKIVWSINNNIGGTDTIYGGAGNDIIVGGAGTDTIYAGDGNDWVAGDNARFDFEPVSGNDGLTRIKTIQTTAPDFGGNDTISGNAGNDLLIGGTGDDIIDGGTDANIVLGDQGTVVLVNGIVSSIEDPGTNGDDLLTGGSGVDVIIGGLGNDTLSGLGGADILIGDAARVLFAADGSGPVRIETFDREHGGVDTIYGGAGDDILIGGTNSDNLDGGSEQDLIFGDNVLLQNNRLSGDAIDPRFRALAGTVIYDANGLPRVSGPFAQSIQPVPGGRPAWSDWTMTFDQTLTASHFGDDYIAGGAGNDEIFGQLGNDTIQGDGSIDLSMTNGKRVSALRDASNLLLINPSFEAATDGDDYIEGNGGNDVIFGNLGQDDIIGGSSNLFSLSTPALRPDGSDLIFGGAGKAVARNDAGDLSAAGHARDADMILGDNGNIYRLVGINGSNNGAYLSFNYDNYNTLKIIPRVAELLDYTPGGQDYNPIGAASDIGSADEIHGEAGDDFIYGMKGNDILFGEGQDDDLLGGYGNDWISGGAGDDGVLGDDGRISTSRNGTAEPLYGIGSLSGQLDQIISTPGKIQQATINVTGHLKKTGDLTPFSVDPAWIAQADEFGGGSHHNNDDILYGGLGSDVLHGGSGDDAISGAEALTSLQITGSDPTGQIYPSYDRPFNNGNVLGYNPVMTTFARYDEYNPLAKIPGFLLNFNAGEGPVDSRSTSTPAKQTDGDDVLFGDLGNDWLVGGTGKDHLYGGWGDDLLNADDDLETAGGANTGTDTDPGYEDLAYGGAGRDVLIANTGGDRLIDWIGEFNSYIVPFAPFGMATVSRTVQPQLPEFLYALSASDGADPTRSADTGAEAIRNGEPWGELGVVIQKDFAWHDQTGGPRDPQAGNLPGGQRDVLRSATFNTVNTANPLDGFAVDSGSWTVANGTLQVAAQSLGKDAAAVFYVDQALPDYYEVQASLSVTKPTAGWKANAYIVFDYYSPTDFKFAGIDAALNKMVMGHRNAQGWIVDGQASVAGSVKSDTVYNLLLAVNGTVATLSVNNTALFSYAFSPRVVNGYSYNLNMGMVGVGSNNSRGVFDNITVQRVAPQAAFSNTEDFSDGKADLFTGAQSGVWAVAAGRYSGTPQGDRAQVIMDLSGVLGLPAGSFHVNASAQLTLQTTINTAKMAGLIFDYYGPEDFKFAAVQADTDQVIIGHHTKSGWFFDKVVSKTIDAGVDYTLAVSLKGTTVSVTVNGQAVAGYAYNASVVDGFSGLVTRGGPATFDNVMVKTDDPAFLKVGSPQLAAMVNTATAPQELLPSALAPIRDAAIKLWSGQVDSARQAVLADVNFLITDLPGQELGQTSGQTILLDATAAGNNWFIDLTPLDNTEFQRVNGNGELLATPSSPAYGRMDLLTVVAHELGHILGLDDDTVSNGLSPDVMSSGLPTGVRYTITSQVGNGTGQMNAKGGNPAGVEEVLLFNARTGRFQNPHDDRAVFASLMGSYTSVLRNEDSSGQAGRTPFRPDFSDFLFVTGEAGKSGWTTDHDKDKSPDSNLILKVDSGLTKNLKSNRINFL